MTGRRPNIFWKACWMVISPLLLLVVFVAYVVVQAQTRPTYQAWNPDYVSRKAKNWRMNLLIIQDFIRCSLFGPLFIFRTAPIFSSITSQRYITGLRSFNCGDNLSTVNSLLWSINHFEMIWAVSHSELSWRKMLLKIKLTSEMNPAARLLPEKQLSVMSVNKQARV